MKKKEKKKVYGIFGVMCLTVILCLVTYFFINYTKDDAMYNERVGNINYTIAPSDTITLVNVNPISSEAIDDELSNCQTVTILINGKTNYDEDAEYLITFDQVKNTINGKIVPISYQSAAYGLGRESNDYFGERNYNETIYQLNDNGLILQDGIITIGYIKKGETELSGTVIVTSFIDIDKIASFGDEIDSSNEKVSFTPEEWEDVITKGVSFKVKVDIKKGVWFNK